MSDHHPLAQAMCSIDLTDSQWTQDLPLLPVPNLCLTINRYLASVKAILQPSSLELSRLRGIKASASQLEAKRRQYEQTERLAKQFLLDAGPQLQRDLKEYANKCLNWATEYWLQDMYLSNPLPLPVNSNPFFMFPRQRFASSDEMLMFATRIIQFSVDFKFRIDQQALRQDFGSGHGKGKPLCMETYKHFFHSYRMPHQDMDRLLPQSRRSNHIVVASCNQFYVLRLGQDPLDNPYRKDACALLNESGIYEQLWCIYRVSRETARRQSNAGGSKKQAIIPKIGLFTTENRKVWAKLHKKLSHTGQTGEISTSQQSAENNHAIRANMESLRQIEDCLFVMCLDSLVNTHPEPARANPDDPVQEATIVLNGGGSDLFSANRWFDKFLQIIVGRNGVCGINIEHSASEGITVLRFLQEFMDFLQANPISDSLARLPGFAFKTSAANVNQVHHQPATANQSITAPDYVEPRSPSSLLEESHKITQLNWILDQELQSALNEAELKINALVRNFSLNILTFQEFGSKFIQEKKVSPDACIQLALQYAFFKLHGQLVSTYESASLRQFRLGRVDNIRANTCEAFDWIQAMLAVKEQPSRSAEAKQAFSKAMAKQVEILKYTITGHGPDNHLAVLKQLAKIRYYDELPDLFTDQSYSDFLNFRLSTSQLPNESGITVGYGAVTPDGYGCSYNPTASKIIFCISSFVDCPETSSSKFANSLRESLCEIRDLCLT